MNIFDKAIYPVGFCISPFTSADFQTLPSEVCNQVIPHQNEDTRLAEIRNDQEFCTALTTQITAMQTSFKTQRKQLDDKIHELITTNTALQLRVGAIQAQSTSILLLKDERASALEEQNKKMQADMTKLIEQQAEKKKQIQELIDAAATEGQQALVAATAIWNSTENTLCSRVQSLQSQLNTLQTNVNAAEQEKRQLASKKGSLENNIISLRRGIESHQTTLNGESARQQAAIKTTIAEKKQHILDLLNRSINHWHGSNGASSCNGNAYEHHSCAWVYKKTRDTISSL